MTLRDQIGIVKNCITRLSELQHPLAKENRKHGELINFALMMATNRQVLAELELQQKKDDLDVLTTVLSVQTSTIEKLRSQIVKDEENLGVYDMLGGCLPDESGTDSGDVPD